jgi:hypothetical protein
MRNLPYFDIKGCCKATINYKSRLIDYNSFNHDYFASESKDWDHRPQRIAVYSDDTGEEAGPEHVFWVAKGRESGGVQYLLNVRHGEMTEDWIRYYTLPPHDIRVFFDNLKDHYRSLKLILSPRRITIAVDNVVDERTEKISEEVCAQTDSF